MRLIRFWSVLLVAGSLGACKKNNNGTGGDDAANIIKDSVLQITRDVYLWNDQIPSDFNARSYDGPPEIMTAIRQYSKEDGFADPVDHYSFAMTQEEWNNTSSGISSDFGLFAFFKSDGDLRVRAVESASPAGLAGIRRGWKIKKVNGNSDMSTSNTDFLSKNIYGSASTSFTFEKPDGSSVDITLNAAQYQEHPVYLDTIYTAGSKKVGYLVFNSFLGDTIQVNAQFKTIFQKFKTAGIDALVVDLRYNGGGYVSLQQELADYIVPPIANGSIMMKQKFNSNYSALNETDVFQKKGELNISSLFFIVSDNTASASELLINNLKPYVTTKLVGEATYGKPVGFFPLAAGKYFIFPVSFRTVNSLDEGSYFDGIQVDQAAPDGVDKDWGDVTESRLASVLKYVNTGSFSFAPDRGTGLFSTLAQPALIPANARLSKVRFRGSVGKSLR